MKWYQVSVVRMTCTRVTVFVGKGDLAELAEWRKLRNFHLGQQVQH